MIDRRSVMPLTRPGTTVQIIVKDSKLTTGEFRYLKSSQLQPLIVVGNMTNVSYVHTREHFCSNRLHQPAPRCLSPALRCLAPALQCLSPALRCFSFSHSGAQAFWYFFAHRCPILLTPPLAPGGKMAGNTSDAIVSEEHCKLLDQVQAVCVHLTCKIRYHTMHPTINYVIYTTTSHLRDRHSPTANGKTKAAGSRGTMHATRSVSCRSPTHIQSFLSSPLRSRVCHHWRTVSHPPTCVHHLCICVLHVWCALLAAWQLCIVWMARMCIPNH